MKNIWVLMLGFSVIGIGAYGGGIVTVPLIERELVQTHELLSGDQISQIVAIAQMTPGPIAVNAATFVGFEVASLPGALIATGIVVSPAIIILTIVSFFRSDGEPNEHFRRLRAGLRAGVLSLLLFATWSYGARVTKGWIELVMAVTAFLILVSLEGKLHPLVVIIGSGITGMIIFSLL